jgi:DNA-binding transcriptional LysR family regulator
LTLGLVAAGLGISIVPVSMSRMNMDGVAYRRLKGTAHAKAILNLASRRGDPSAVVRHFLDSVRQAARNFHEDR